MVEVKKSSKQEAVKVIVRCRPLSSKEIENGHTKIVHMRTDRGQIELRNLKEQDEPSKDFTFDAIYDENSTQSSLYEETFRDLVDSVLNGYNATIFAYGQTGTGKTHTMEGKSDIPEQRGVIYKCIDHIFEHIANSRNQQYLVRASYLEIYQEELRDLLNRDALKKLDIKERPDGGVYVKDLSAVVTSSAEAIQKVMSTGNSQRSVGRTDMNEHSSRSHAIFIITVECSQVGVDGENHITVGRLNLVDLAGSERQAKTGATGERFKEATKINLSLSALGNVISALVDAKSSHVPYRDSKLTRLLQDSLGGNSKTVMVACIGPASYNYEETLGTLRYANRAKNIKNQPKINEDPKDALLREFQEEIQRLRERLEQRKAKSHGPVSQSFYDEERERLEGDMEKIMNDDSLIRQEKEKLMKELEQKSRLLERERIEQARVAELIASIQSRLISGEGSDQLETKTKEQQMQLEKKRKELTEQKKREREMAELLERQEEDTVDLRQTFSDLRTEVEAKTKKLKKLIMKLRQARNEIRDTSAAFSDDRQDLDQSIAEINKELKLKLLIVENFIPREVGERIKERSEWNEEDSCWNVNSYHPVSASSSSSSPLIIEGNDGMLVRSSGADSGVSVGGHSSPSTSQFLDKRLVATPGVRRPMSMCERIHIEKSRDQLSGQRRPPISGSGAYVEALIPEETIRFCGENIVVFSALERFVPDVSDGDPNFVMSTTDRRSSSESLTIDASKILAPIMNQSPLPYKPSKNGTARNDYHHQRTTNGRGSKIDNMESSNKTTTDLNESSDSSEGICADMSISATTKGFGFMPTDVSSRSSTFNGSSPPARCSMSLHNSMLSSFSTPRRLPSRIPALMTRSLSSNPRIPQHGIHGSGEDLCDIGMNRNSSHVEAEMLLSRSQERRKIRASSFDPRCLFALHSGGGSSGMSASNSMMMSSSYSPTHARLLPKRPQWIRHQQTNQMAEDAINLQKILEHARRKKLLEEEAEERRRQEYLRKVRIFGISTKFCMKNRRCLRRNRIYASFRRLQIRKKSPKHSKKSRRQLCACSKDRSRKVYTIPHNPFRIDDPCSLSVLFLVIAFIFRILLFISEFFLFH